MAQPDTDDDLNCSRLSQVFGTLDDSIELRINGDFKLDLMREARKRGYSNHSEFIRVEMAKAMWGEAHVISLVTKQILGDRATVGQTPGGAA